MRARIRTATKDRVDHHARGRRVSPSFIAREAIAACAGVNLGVYREQVTRLNSVVIEWACDLPEGVRLDSLMNYHLDQNPGPKISPIVLDPEDVEQLGLTPTYTTPFSG